MLVLQHGVGLQPGEIHPLLKRLESEGFLERSEQQKRRRRLMTVTNEGEQFMDGEWRECLRDYPDVGSILRAATVAILMGQWQMAQEYLVGIAAQHERNLPVAPDDSRQRELVARGVVSAHALDMGEQTTQIRGRCIPGDRKRLGGHETKLTKVTHRFRQLHRKLVSRRCPTTVLSPHLGSTRRVISSYI